MVSGPVAAARLRGGFYLAILLDDHHLRRFSRRRARRRPATREPGLGLARHSLTRDGTDKHKRPRTMLFTPFARNNAAHALVLLIASCVVFLSLARVSSAAPSPTETRVRVRVIRDADDANEPKFPDQPPSCPICAAKYDSISSCAQAAPVLANVSMVCHPASCAAVCD